MHLVLYYEILYYLFHGTYIFYCCFLLSKTLANLILFLHIISLYLLNILVQHQSIHTFFYRHILVMGFRFPNLSLLLLLCLLDLVLNISMFRFLHLFSSCFLLLLCVLLFLFEMLIILSIILYCFFLQVLIHIQYNFLLIILLLLVHVNICHIDLLLFLLHILDILILYLCLVKIFGIFRNMLVLLFFRIYIRFCISLKIVLLLFLHGMGHKFYYISHKKNLVF